MVESFTIESFGDQESAMYPLAPLVVIAMASVAMVGDPPASPTLDQLAAEATRVRLESPDRWLADEGRVDRTVADHDRLLQGWRKRSSPPPLDLKPLGLRLNFLVAKARRLNESAKPSDPKLAGLMPGQAAPSIKGLDLVLLVAILDAIAHNADDRRLEAILEYRDALERRFPGIDRSLPWPRLIADAATLGWATDRVRDLARQAPKLNLSAPQVSLTFLILDRFAHELPADASTIAYDYLRGQYPGSPRNGDQIWELLLKLDPARARREILPYFDKPAGHGFAYNIYVVTLLRDHAGPSPELAQAARGWLARGDIDPYHRRDLRLILLRADPDQELKPTVEHIDQEIAGRAPDNAMPSRTDDVAHLVLALGQVGSKEADDAQARYVFERAIPDRTRALALETLVRKGYPEARALLARWLLEESPHMRDHLRKKAAEDWGETGKSLLREINRPEAGNPEKPAGPVLRRGENRGNLAQFGPGSIHLAAPPRERSGEPIVSKASTGR